jgi:hypothetical protein
VAFTPITLTHRFIDADGRPARGTVRLTPVAPMVNGDTVVAAWVEPSLDAEGDLTVQVMATTDPDTTVPGAGSAAYRVEEKIDGVRQRRSYLVQVPHDAVDGAADLATLDELVEPTPLVPVAPIVNTDGQPGRRIFVGTTSPASPAVGDVWITPA